MKTIVGIAIGLGVIAVGTLLYAMNKKKDPVLEETVEGDLKLEDLVAYFKTLSMVKGKQIPFLALPDAAQIKSIWKGKARKAKTLIVGIYNKDNDTPNPTKIVYADGFDEELVKLFGNEKIVVLN